MSHNIVLACLIIVGCVHSRKVQPLSGIYSILGKDSASVVRFVKSEYHAGQDSAEWLPPFRILSFTCDPFNLGVNGLAEFVLVNDRDSAMEWTIHPSEVRRNSAQLFQQLCDTIAARFGEPIELVKGQKHWHIQGVDIVATGIVASFISVSLHYQHDDILGRVLGEHLKLRMRAKGVDPDTVSRYEQTR